MSAVSFLPIERRSFNLVEIQVSSSRTKAGSHGASQIFSFCFPLILSHGTRLSIAPGATCELPRNAFTHFARLLIQVYRCACREKFNADSFIGASVSTFVSMLLNMR